MRNSGRNSWAYIWWVAWRNFSARRRGSGLSFMTTVSILGVMIGVAALVVVLSVMGGFEQDLRKKMLSGEPHLEILAENALAGFSLKDFPLEQFKKEFPEAVTIEPFVNVDVVLKRKGFVTSANLIAIRPNMKGSKLWAFDDMFIEGGIDELATQSKPKYPQDQNAIRELPGIALGDQLALQIGADVGDEISVLSPHASAGTALAGGTLSRSYVVTGKFSTGLFNYDGRWAVSDLNEGRFFLADYDSTLTEQEYVTGVAMTLRDPMKMDFVKERVKAFPGLKFHTWQQTHSSLLVALKLEKFTMGAILMLIVLVAAFSISGTMMMTVMNKKYEVSIMRALGMSKDHILKVFIANGLIIGSAGVVSGLLLGLLLCRIILVSKGLELPQGIYYLRTLPVKFLPIEYVVICISAWILSIGASLYPAFAASSQDPSEGLRYE